MRIEADTLQEAFSKAAAQLSCSVTKLEIDVIQHPRAGLFGIFKKSAIIEARREGEIRRKEEKFTVKIGQKPEVPKKSKPAPKKEIQEAEKPQKSSASTQVTPKQNTPFSKQREYADIKKVLPEIKKGVGDLVKNSCFDVHVAKVEEYDSQTILIEIDGEDAALLIGKEGYRYKAFSYLLYNWINIKYGLGIRLEIAQFLHNQEEMIENYLISIIERINEQGRGQTKPLDGVLIKIALEKLRARFPDKYVGIKTGREGRKFIVVNDFNRKAT
ncbi:MAG: hypothetical protein GX780_03210 [Campylobacteraceae bacterium]|nr:hypothetical protein [Campylobacteraceae bacterium]